MRTILPGLPLPSITRTHRGGKDKQRFHIGDEVNYHFRNIDHWAKSSRVEGVRQYKFFGMTWFVYNIGFTKATQRRLIKDQEVYEKIHGIKEANVVKNKHKRKWGVETYGAW
jgi:hypothetical protein